MCASVHRRPSLSSDFRRLRLAFSLALFWTGRIYFLMEKLSRLVPTTFALSEEMNGRLDAVARAEQRSRSAVVRRVLETQLATMERQLDAGRAQEAALAAVRLPRQAAEDLQR